MISVDIKRKAFGETQILEDIAFTIDRGTCLALLGPSGIGKTTLLRIVTGLDEDFEGKIDRPDKTVMVFQEPTLLPWRSAHDNITLVAGVGAGEADRALAEVGLSDKTDLYPNQLSLGQQRRLALARAFSVKPQFMVMDEPFASLDSDRVEDMIALYRNLSADHGTTTLFVTHSQREAEALADRIIRIDGQPARLIEEG